MLGQSLPWVPLVTRDSYRGEGNWPRPVRPEGISKGQCSWKAGVSLSQIPGAAPIPAVCPLTQRAWRLEESPWGLAAVVKTVISLLLQSPEASPARALETGRPVVRGLFTQP